MKRQWRFSDRNIAREIVLAQVASDGGKNIPDLEKICTGSKKSWWLGYEIKDTHINNAIRMIQASKESNFRFYVCQGDLRHSILIYFQFHLGTERCQISFHSFDGSLLHYAKATAFATRWDHGSSRDTAEALARSYNL